MTETKFDIVVIGGGPGGYVAAIRAAQLKMKVALVEANHLGGVCLNWGCIPTKALLRSAEVGHLINDAEAYGWKVEKATFDLDKIVKRSRDVAGQLSTGVGFLMKKNKVTVFDGLGKLAGKGKVQVTDPKGKEVAALQAKHIILATGARARELPGMKPDGDRIWDYRDAMVPKKLPKSLLIVGSGAIGVEFASFYNDLGVDVTILEVVDRIMPVEDKEISEFAAKSFTKQGIKILTGAMVKSVEKSKTAVKAQVEIGGKMQTLEAEHMISAVGIVGNVEGVGLEGTKVKVDRTHVVVDKWCKTGEAGVYAIGDLAGPPWLAHKASHEGTMCVEKIAGVESAHPLDTGNIPGCTYARPQVASVGMTEEAASEAGHKVRVGRFPFIGNGKAIALGDAEGLVKTIFDEKTGELLGAHMIGAEVTELIQGFGIARTLETTEAELMQTIFAHPTLSEMMHESVLDAYGKAIHM